MPDSPSSPPETDPIIAALRRWFGFDVFRDGQEEVVRAILAGRDVLTVMPTGGGKSLCFQLPALVAGDGVALVVSPLIALMKDQVDALVARGIAATMINSHVSGSEQSERLQGLREGRFRLVYVAPERFRSTGFLNALSRVNVRFLAIDEAHCLSQWGHDFRPDYLRLGEARRRLGDPPVAAFTATATPVVREDIRQSLRLRDPLELVSGFERPNLALNVTHVDNKSEKTDRLLEVIRQWKTGIVYCATRRSVEEVAALLRGEKVRVIEYHAGMDDARRKRAQELFIERRRDVAVATNAFGMGIDRSDVRFVAHWEIPGSVEAWYQEAGRAGRDGRPACCDLLFNYADTRTQEFFIEGANPGEDMIRKVYHLIRSHADDKHQVLLSIDEMAEALDVRNSMAVSSSISWLARAGAIERFDVPGVRKRGTRLSDPGLRAADLQIDAAALREKERRDRARLDAMINLCYSNSCRQAWVLQYFGEKSPQPCGRCDACATGTNKPRLPTLEESNRLRMALSGVARASARNADGTFRPRFGRRKIQRMLLGDEGEDLATSGLAALSTFGLMKDCGEDYLRDLFKAMEDAGLIATDESGEYPLLTLTETGLRVMRGESDPELVWPNNGTQAPRKPAPKRPSGKAARRKPLPKWLKEKIERQRKAKR